MMNRLRITTTDPPPPSHSPHSTITSIINVCAVAAKVRHKIIVECSRILNYISVELSSRQPRASVVPYMVYYIYIIPPPLPPPLPSMPFPRPYTLCLTLHMAPNMPTLAVCLSSAQFSRKYFHLNRLLVGRSAETCCKFCFMHTSKQQTYMCVYIYLSKWK